METENFTIDLQKEYLRTLLATRVAATVCLLLAAAWCWLKYDGLDRGMEVFENMVTGGFDAMPTFTRTVIGNGDTIAAIAALGGLGALGWIWFSGRSISRVIYAAMLALVCYLIIGAAFDFAVTQPLITIITQFNG